MTRFKSKSFAILRKFYPFFMALVICITGYTVVYSHIYNKNQALTINTNHVIIGKIDNLYTSLRSIAISISQFTELNCLVIKPSLQKIISRLPNIKSITLLENNQPYCSSNDNITIDHIPPVDSNKLLLEPSSSDTYLIFWKNQLYLKQIVSPTKHIILLIDIGDYQVLKDILVPRNSLQLITLKLNNHILTNKGIQTEPIKTYQSVTERSFRNYNFYIKTGYTVPLNLPTMIQYHSMALFVVFLLAIFAYFITHWFIRNIANAYYELNSAIKNNQIKAYAQPVFESQTGKITGVEILARWHHPKFGLINPDTFIPAAEETGLIIALTQSLIKQVAKSLAPYAERIPVGFHVGFNISHEHCNDLQLVEDCKKFYTKLKNKNIILVIEITERELIAVTDTTKKLFQELHTLNAKIALDDFGIGNSNLSYLNDFAIDYLKIDKSFISHIGSEALSKNILDSIIDITHGCQIESCAEGVETEEQANYLKAKGVTYLQGYFFSHPIAIEEFIEHQLFQDSLLP